jgi:hypothetical protein
MTVSPELLLAILAMDSYNREYGAGLTVNGNTIGAATFINHTDSGVSTTEYQAWQAAGFYAAAYDLGGGEIVISYRGTDASPDYTKGWVIAAGKVDADTQAPLALAFYTAVTGISVTLH